MKPKPKPDKQLTNSQILRKQREAQYEKMMKEKKK